MDKLTERVRVRYRVFPAVFVAPYSQEDDPFSGYIAELTANALNATSVINLGWKKASSVIPKRDFANCGVLSHALSNVVRQEFVDPIARAASRILNTYSRAHVFVVRGINQSEVQKPNVDIIVETGTKTCEKWRANAFIEHAHQSGLTTLKVAPGDDDLTQLFLNFRTSDQINLIGVKIIDDLRADEDIAKLVAKCLAEVGSKTVTQANTTD